MLPFLGDWKVTVAFDEIYWVFLFKPDYTAVVVSIMQLVYFSVRPQFFLFVGLHFILRDFKVPRSEKKSNLVLKHTNCS